MEGGRSSQPETLLRAATNRTWDSRAPADTSFWCDVSIPKIGTLRR